MSHAELCHRRLHPQQVPRVDRAPYEHLQSLVEGKSRHNRDVQPALPGCRTCILPFERLEV
jgi:hypothetical protein